MAKANIIPPSLQPRKMEKKPIPNSPAIEEAPLRKNPDPSPTLPEPEPEAPPKVDKKRFTLWLQPEVFRAFKVHTAGNDGSASSYIEGLIRRDLNL